MKFGLGKKIVKQVQSEMPQDIAAIQKMTKEALQSSIEEVKKDLPDIVSNQKQSMQGLEQLSKNVQSMIKQKAF